MERVTAIFDDRNQAEKAVTELRQLGVDDNQLGILARHEGEEFAKDTDASACVEAGKTAGGAGVGALAGAGVGALFGLAAAAIAGPVGPFITAGFLYSSLGAAGGGAVAGAAVGGTAGAISGALARAGYTKEEAEYYGGEVEQGAVLVSVETDSATSAERARAVLMQHGGHTRSTAGAVA